ncbi:MAG: metallophosphoesterase family protein, partial [Proteobacteria bacterium]|nr:metallophosphoesterase family protein [Pseudomonadota bacterium]
MPPDASGRLDETIRFAGGPVLLFGGPYSNLLATLAMQAEAVRLGMPPERVICTGDVVAYAAEPAETVRLIRDWGIRTVMGNCEESLGFAAQDCGCGFEAGSDCDLLSRRWYAYSDARLGGDDRAWMRGLPRSIIFTLAGRRFAVVHGSADEINEFVFETSDDASKRAGFDALGVDAVIGGHAGIPFSQLIDGRLWHNAGVIGMPAHDGTARVWYSMLRVTDAGIAISRHALSYDHAAAAAAMRAASLPEG